MQITYLSYFLASIIAYIGLLLGIILIKLAPEEQKPGKKYFILFKKMLFFIILSSLLVFYQINIILSLGLLLATVILVLNEKINLEESAIIYFLFGIVFYLGSKIPAFFIIISVLVFLYGIPNSSLIFNIQKRNYSDIFIRNIYFFIPAVFLYLMF